MEEWYHHLRNILVHAGAAGLLVMGVLDASLIPTPGGQDLLVIVLSASYPEWWVYYGIVGTIGSVFGASVTYRLGRGGGKRALETRLSAPMRTRVSALFERWGAVALFLAAILPPPMPMSPFLLVAGALHYPWPRFVAALTFARAIRYGAAAYLAAVYGRRALAALFAQDYRIILLAALGLGVGVCMVVVAWRLLVARHGRMVARRRGRRGTLTAD